MESAERGGAASRTLEVAVTIQRKRGGLPAFVTVPAAAVARWGLTATTTVEATLDGHPLARRSLKRWDDERWFLELRREHLAAVGKAPGERAKLAMTVASTELPGELADLIETVAEARECWEASSDAQRRIVREEVLAARRSATRVRRARRALLGERSAGDRAGRRG